jgi:hypothetical protein
VNCKPGDLALIIGGLKENVGKMVRCIRLIEHGEIVQTRAGKHRINDTAHPTWAVDRLIRNMLTKDNVLVGYTEAPVAFDRYLMPIRPPPDGEPSEESEKRETSALHRRAMVPRALVDIWQWRSR